MQKLPENLQKAIENRRNKNTDPVSEAAMEVVTLDQSREQLARSEQEDKEQRIAESYEVAGRIQALTFVGKVLTVGTLMQLANIKKSKAYRDLPNIGTWDNYCEYLGFSRQKVDLDLSNLAVFGEEFLLTVSGFSLGYRDLRKLRRLNSEGVLQIKDNEVQIGDERIPFSPDSKEELEIALERLVEAKDEIIREKEATLRANQKIIDSKQDLIRRQAAYGSATFAYVLGNTLYRRMIQDYRETSDFGVSRLVGGNIRNARDFRTMESINIGYYGDLPDVSTETEDFPDLGVVGDEQVEYALNQKGGLITFTRIMLINDDQRVVERIISRLPRAARRTLAKRCWGKFINNGTYGGDGKAVFHVDHGNLGSAAYSIDAALAAKTAMGKQAEPESGERLQLRPVTVVYPTELYGIIKNVNEFQPQAVSVDNGNSMYGFFKPEGMVECPFMTDATDWMMFADPAEVEILELAFLNGQQEPEMFVADQPGVGQVFVGDKIQYKIRHEYECAITDYRGAYKSVVAG